MGIDGNFKKFLKNRYSAAWIKNINTKNVSNKKLKKVADSSFKEDKEQELHDNTNNHDLENNHDKEIPNYYCESPIRIKNRKPIHFPNDVSVCLFDCSLKLKNYPTYFINNGLDYIYKYVLYEAISFLGMETGTEAFFLCFDRGSPVNKEMTHKKRYDKLVMHDLNVLKDETVFIDDSRIIDKKDWPLFCNNKILYQELLYYITKTIVDLDSIKLEQEPTLTNNNDDKFNSLIDMYRNDDYNYSYDSPHYKPKKISYTPPENKMLFLFGGIRDEPNKKRIDRISRKPDPELYYIGNEKINIQNDNSSDMDYDNLFSNSVNAKYRRIQGIYQPHDNVYKLEEQAELLEGELSCLYFAKPYISVGKNIMIITGDGDLILQLLIGCKDRLDKDGKFINKIYLRMLIDNDYEDIDINALFILMCEDYIFKSCGITDPSIYFCIASCLIKNDYFDKYCTGIKNLNLSKLETNNTNNKTKDPDDNSSSSCPFILYTLLSLLPKYKHMITIEPKNRTNFENVIVTIDENLFIKFTNSIYYMKYHKKALRKYDSGSYATTLSLLKNTTKTEDIDIDNLNKNTIKKKHMDIVKQHIDNCLTKDNKIPNDSTIKIYSRMLEWTLNYYYNGYRGSCKIVSPLSTFNNESYYGWEISVTNNCCVIAKSVCETKKQTIESSWIPNLINITFTNSNSTQKLNTMSDITNNEKQQQTNTSLTLKENNESNANSNNPDSIVSEIDQLILQIEEIKQNYNQPNETKKSLLSLLFLIDDDNEQKNVSNNNNNSKNDEQISSFKRNGSLAKKRKLSDSDNNNNNNNHGHANKKFKSSSNSKNDKQSNLDKIDTNHGKSNYTKKKSKISIKPKISIGSDEKIVSSKHLKEIHF